MCDKSIIRISHDECTGCMMCGDVCSKEAIEFKMEKGFWFPTVDEDKCVNCSLCYNKCPVSPEKNQSHENNVIRCFGAKTKDESIRYNSTSGGFFSALANNWIKKGGIVVGAEYGEEQEIKHVVVSELEGVEKLRQSKYAQSNTEGVYKQIKQLLINGQSILFCGTPCQVAALKSLVGETYDNLLTMDFVCLGICSPLVYRRYLQMMERKYKSKVKRVWFKDKRTGWRNVGTSVLMENGKEYYRISSHDLFMVSFIRDTLSLRKSCHSCKFRNLHHSSDITIGDFWGVEKINKQIDDNMGVSAILVNTEKGLCNFESIKENLTYFETNVDAIVAGNFTIVRPKPAHPNRDLFMEYIENHSLVESMKKFSSISGMKYYVFCLNYYKYLIKNKLKSVLKHG